MLNVLDAINELIHIEIYAISPIDGADTDQDTDESDDEYEGNLKHLGPKLLSAQCEVARKDRNDWYDSDNEPLKKYLRVSSMSNRQTNTNFWRKIEPSYEINKVCTMVPTSAETHLCKPPTEFFELFFSEDIIRHFVEQTNLYGFQKNVDLQITLQEIKVCLGSMLMSGYAKYPNKRLVQTTLTVLNCYPIA